jgi:TPR repeat protein
MRVLYFFNRKLSKLEIGKIAAAGILLVALAGCAGAAIEGANIVRDKAIVANNINAARAGNAIAQYKVGEALCCSLNEGSGFYNTPRSVDWLCQAATQGNADAAFKLGQIYSGDTVDGVRIIRRVGAALAGASTDIPVAYSWFRHAEAGGNKDAVNISAKIWHEMSPSDRDTAAAMLTGKAPLRCHWDEVIRKG